MNIMNDAYERNMYMFNKVLTKNEIMKYLLTNVTKISVLYTDCLQRKLL